MTRESLRAGFGLLFGAQLFYKVTSLVFYLVLSRRLAPGDLGLYFFVLSICQSLLVLASFNLNPLFNARIGAAARAPGDDLADALGLRLLLAPAYLVAVGAYALFFEPADAGVFVTIALFTVLEDAYSTFAVLFIGLSRVRYNVSVGVLVQTFLVGGTALGLWLRPSLDTLLALHVVRALVLVGVSALLTRGRITPLRLRFSRGYARATLPFIALASFAVLADQLDTILLGTFVDYATLGSYVVSLRTVLAGVFIAGVAAAVLYPRLAAGRDRELVGKAVAAMIVIGVAGAVLCFALAGPLGRIIYPALAVETAATLRRLSWLAFVMLPQTLICALLPALGEERRALVAVVAATVVLAAGDLIALPRWGVAAAPYVRALSALTQLALAAPGLRRAH